MGARSTSLLRGPRLKIKRAEQHISELDRQIDAFLAEKPFQLEINTNPKASQRTHDIKTKKPVPDDFSLLIGDAVHNVWSALDLLMFAMVGDKAKNPDGIYFPFAKCKAALKDTIANRQVHLAGKDVVAELELIRPYEGGDELLCGLRALDIADKHKLIITTGKAADLSADQFRSIDPAVPFVGPGVLRFAGESDTLLTVKLSGLNRQMRRHTAPTTHKPYTQPTFQICFGKSEPFAMQPVIPKLKQMSVRVSEICDRLVQAFLK